MSRIAYMAVVIALSAGCRATFVDFQERPVPDLGEPVLDLAGMDLAGADAPEEAVLAAGSWEGRAGHAGSGSAQLVRRADGMIELRMGADFAASPVPGPVVILTSRESMGTSIVRPEDLELGPLKATSGAQAYPLLDDGGRRIAFVFCKPFGVEVARAVLR